MCGMKSVWNRSVSHALFSAQKGRHRSDGFLFHPIGNCCNLVDAERKQA